MIAAMVASLVLTIALFAGVVVVWRREDEDERRMEWMQ